MSSVNPYESARETAVSDASLPTFDPAAPGPVEEGSDIVLRYRLTHQDVMSCGLHRLCVSPQRRRLYLLGMTITLTCAVAMVAATVAVAFLRLWDSVLVMMFLWLIALTGLACIVGRRGYMTRWLTRYSMAWIPHDLGASITIQSTPTGVVVHNPSAGSKRHWKLLASVIAEPSYLWIVIAPGHILLVPAHAFRDRQQLTAFASLLRRKHCPKSKVEARQWARQAHSANQE